ncbi:MAG: ABC transporter permease, partial [Mycobacteriales bacterium]
PLFYLLSIGVGIGKLVGHVAAVAGHPMSYQEFVAPALLAASAMNGAIFDATFNMFHKLRYAKTYDAVLATPIGTADVAIGEAGWAVLRSGLYSTAFLIVMAGLGLVPSWWALADLPVALLIWLSFAACGMAATCYMRTFQDFQFVTLAILPMFLFSATFYPLTVYPDPLRLLVEITPLYQGVALLRGFTYGVPAAALIWHAAYLVVLTLSGLLITKRRLSR